MNDDMRAKCRLETLLDDLRGNSSALLALSEIISKSNEHEMFFDGLQFITCNLLEVSGKLDMLYKKIDGINVKKPLTE